jgi:hypothetical protein
VSTWNLPCAASLRPSAQPTWPQKHEDLAADAASLAQAEPQNFSPASTRHWQGGCAHFFKVSDAMLLSPLVDWIDSRRRSQFRSDSRFLCRGMTRNRSTAPVPCAPGPPAPLPFRSLFPLSTSPFCKMHRRNPKTRLTQRHLRFSEHRWQYTTHCIRQPEGARVRQCEGVRELYR